LKRAVTEEPVLRLPDYTVPFEVHTEASDYAIGRVLVQEGHPVAYESRKLNETERRGPRERDDSCGALPEDMEALLAFGLDLWSRLVATSDFATQKKLSPKRAGRISWLSLTLCWSQSISKEELTQ
jgi:hypothetical protein